MENYYFSQSSNQWIRVFDKRLSLSFYEMWIKPLLIECRKLIIKGKIEKALELIQLHINHIRKAFGFINPYFNKFFISISIHIIEFLRSDITKSYSFWKYQIQNDYKIIMKNIIKYGHIKISDSKAEYFFNIFFGIENFVSDNIFHNLEINFVSLKPEYFYF